MEKLLDRLSRSSSDEHSDRLRTAPAHEPASAPPRDSGHDDDLLGLFQLWPLKPEGFQVDKTKIDIVAVHGLNGKAYKTWTEDGKLWLADFLPQDIPYARIFTYGYNSGIAFTGSASRVDDYARTLLERLMAKRRQFTHAEKRPLLFICHSLGGIVVKKALVIAHERSRRYSSITRDTYGIMFLGTPHRGSDGAFWGKLFGSLADVLTLGSIRTELLGDLKRKSDVLGATCTQFVERSQSLHRIFSIYERVRIKGLPTLVVEEDSAIMGLPNEIPIPTEADHRSMCRFSSMKSERYQMILDCIREMVEDALDLAQEPETSLHTTFLRCIKTVDPDETLRNVPRPSPGTCSWITETDSFTAFRDKPNTQLLWISGVPGSGKTTASRYLIEHLRRWLQRNPTSSGRTPILVFFFCDSKQWLRSSDVQVAKSLLYQLLAHSKQLFRYLNEAELQSYITRVEDAVGDGAEPDCPATIWKFLTTILQRSSDLSFWILVDAVDELDDQSREAFLGQIRNLISQDLGRKLKFIICDRSGPLARGMPGPVCSLDIRQRQDKVAEDVRHFINTQLADLCSSEVIPWQQQNIIEESLVEVAEGNFLQASLAWSHFKAGVSYWSPQVVKSRLEAVRQLSGKAKAFYCSLLERIPEDSQQVAKIGFTWVIGSRKPLNLNELQHAVAISTGQKSWSDLMESLGFNFSAHFDQAFGYLLRVDPDLSVRFAHTTVRELLTSPQADASSPHTGVLARFHIRPADVDAELAKRCIIVLSFRDFVKLRDIAREAMADRMKDFFVTSLQSEQALRSLNFSKYDEPDSAHGQGQDTSELIDKAIHKLGQTGLDDHTRSLFAYCVSYWNYHCNRSSSDPEVCRSLTSFALLRQSHYFIMVAMLLGMAKYHHGPFWNKIDQFSRLPPLHFMLRAGDHPGVLTNLIDAGEDINGLDCHGWTPVVWALLEDRQESLEMLLSHDETSLGPTAHQADHVLHLALRAGVKTGLVLRLLADPRADVNATSSGGWTALQWCLSRQDLESVAYELLRRKDVDIYNRNNQDLNVIEQIYHEGLSEQYALQVCARSDVPEHWFNRDRTVVPMLMPWGSKVAIDEETPRTYLHRASSLGWDSVVGVILKSSPSEAVSTECDGYNLLERYAYHGVKQRLAQALDKLPYDVFNTTPDRGARLLILCAQQDWERIVHLLVQKYSTDDNATDVAGRTIAHWASQLQWQSLPALIASKSRVWINKAGHDGRTALHCAAEHRNETACKALLQAGADSLLRDKAGKLAIHVAAEQGHRAIVSLLLKAPIEDLRAYETDTHGRSLLHYIVMWHSDSFIRQRLHVLRPHINIKDHSGKSPLHMACVFGNEPAASVLLDIGAKPDARDSSSFTPLHHALMSGSVECAQTLIRRGAKYDLLDKFGRNLVILAVLSEQSAMVEYVARFLHSKLSSSEIAKHASHVDGFGRSALHYLCYWVADRKKNNDSDETGEIILEVDDEDWDDHEQPAPISSPVEWLIKTFCSLGADANGRDRCGSTPLHTAAAAGNLAAAQALLRVPRIQPSPTDTEFLTPLDWATVHGHDAVAALIEAHRGEHSTADWRRRLRPLYQPWQSGYGFDDDKPGKEGDRALAVRD